MTIVTTKEFEKNPKHYMRLSKKEEVGVRIGMTIYYITPKKAKVKNNIDPDDPYWDDPRNIEELDRRLKEIEDGTAEFIEYTPELEKEWFGDK